MKSLRRLSMLGLALAACAHPAAVPAPTAPVTAAPVSRPTAAEPAGAPQPQQPVAPPQIAMQLGLMPLDATGVAAWHVEHPQWDGRGVLIGILDSGADLGVAGLQATSTGQRKVLDVRDLSGEGDVPLARVRETLGVIVIDSATVLSGAASVRGLADDSTWYGGVLSELPFGDVPDADFNGNGSNRDRYGIVVFKTGGHWAAMIDTNGDGSLADEAPIADYLVKQETFTFRSRYVPRGAGPITGAVNLSEANGTPALSVFLDNGAHGTHVSGIAAAHDMYGVPGFDGVAPGAQLVVVKIANNARGGVSTNGSMVRGMEYLLHFAQERRMPLVMNMSFGIGNEQEGRAAMDSIVDAFLLAHPEVTFAIAAGNDGPGFSNVGLPGSAAFALTAGAVYPSSFSRPQFGAEGPSIMGWWSSRGGELAKPELSVPGMAFSTVPRWNTGQEIKLGTSMATPYLSGMAALLISAAVAQGRTPTATDLLAALRAGAVPLPGAHGADAGWGMGRIDRSWSWLSAHHTADRLQISVLPTRDVRPGMMPAGGVAPVSPVLPSAFYRRGDLVPGDSIVRFRINLVPGRDGTARLYRLSSDAAWFRPARDTASIDAATGSGVVEVRVNRDELRRAGSYQATVSGTPASDTAAGAAFHLYGTVIVPDTATGRVLLLSSRKLRRGEVARTFVAVPEGASALAVRATIKGDTTTPASLFVFEPSGRPARDDATDDFGGNAGATARALISGNDVQAGVYEVDVVAMPGHDITYDLEITVPDARLTIGESTNAPSVTLSAPRDTSLRVAIAQAGIAKDFDLSVDSGRRLTQRIDVPAWAKSVAIEVTLTREQWNDVTDFAISLFDTTGARIGGDAMNYVFLRSTIAAPEHGFCASPQGATSCPMDVELFPAFARPVPPASFPAHVRVVILGDPSPLGDQLATVSIHAGTPAVFPVPPFRPAAPPGWSDWMVVKASASSRDLASLVRGFEVSRR